MMSSDFRHARSGCERVMSVSTSLPASPDDGGWSSFEPGGPTSEATKFGRSRRRREAIVAESSRKVLRSQLLRLK